MVDAEAREPRLDAQRHDEKRRAAGLRGERAHARLVEMVVVVVRHDDGIDVRQIVDRDPRRHVPLRSEEGSGDARSEKIGSVRTLLPPAWTSVSHGRSRSPTAPSRCRRPRWSAGTRGRARRAGSAAAAASAVHRAMHRSSSARGRPGPWARTRHSCSGSARRVAEHRSRPAHRPASSSMQRWRGRQPRRSWRSGGKTAASAFGSDHARMCVMAPGCRDQRCSRLCSSRSARVSTYNLGLC